MKKTLSVTALLLAILMIALCCVACGDDKKSDSSSDSSSSVSGSIIGTWSNTVSADHTLNPNSNEALQELYLGLKSRMSGIMLKRTITFSDGGTCSGSVDETAVNAVKEAIIGFFTENFDQFIAASGATEEQFNEWLAQNGMTKEQYIALVGDSYVSMSTFNGKYRLDGTKLFICREDEELVDTQYYEIKLTEQELTIVSGVGTEDDDLFNEEYLPYSFTKE